MSEIQVSGSWLKDENGRVLMLRGVNLGGSSKVPVTSGNVTTVSFYDHRHVSFVGRPFPLEEADEHFMRLRRWGLAFLRLIVTWEAIEHAGPGQYDQDYLEYLRELVSIAHYHGLRVFIDPHQDAWSRLSGGDGAPGWTLETVGMNPGNFQETGAAVIHNFTDSPRRMQWLTNYARLAALTMFTLFFGGNDFAPRTKIEGEPVQEFLQRHYINAFKQVALVLRDLPNVIGFGTMNEPSQGFIDTADLRERHDIYFPSGSIPTPFEAILLGAGYSQKIETWKIGLLGPRRIGPRPVNVKNHRAWQPNKSCIWREHGVWEIDEQGQPRLVRPDYFAAVERGGRLVPVEFGRDYLKPFVNRYARAIRSVMPRSIIFVETVPYSKMPHWGPEDAPGVVNATHWYDPFSLYTGFFLPFMGIDIHHRRLVFGRKKVQQMFIDQLAAIKRSGLNRMNGAPTLVGEFGVSFNMPYKLNYWFNWFGTHEWAIDTVFRGFEANLLSGTLWNYTADNTNHLGDRWNGEDFSIFSRDQQTDPADLDSGGRALKAVVRPFPCCIAGEPLDLNFDYQTGDFVFKFRHDPVVQAPTEIFTPDIHYADGYTVEISDGYYEKDLANQRLRYWPGSGQDEHTIHLSRAKQ